MNYGQSGAESLAKREIMAFDGRLLLRDKLKQDLAMLDKRRAEIQEALGLLDRNPDIERLMDLIRN